MSEEEVMERSLPVIPPAAGTDALAFMSDEDFDRNLAAIRKGQQRIARMQRELLVEGVDYGNVPGVDKPSLGKPGAEKLGLAYKLPARIERTLTVGDGITSPPITYDAICHLHLGTFEGPEVGIGYGTCNSWETKYRWRNQERLCPTCGNPTIIAGKAEYGGGWLCFKKRGGCGAKFGAEDPRITGQQVGREDNPEPWDLANTIMKMAEKRAHVDAILRTTAASGIFTQDIEENVGALDVTPTATIAQPPPPRGRNDPPPLTDADLASMGMAHRTPAQKAANVQAVERVEAKVIDVPEPEQITGHPNGIVNPEEVAEGAPVVAPGLSVDELKDLCMKAGKSSVAIAKVLECNVDRVGARVKAMTDVGRGVLADELGIEWRGGAA